MEIKQGDKVRVSKDAQEIFVYGLNPLWFTEESTVVRTYSDGVVIKLDANNYLATGLHIPTKYLIKVDAEAKEQKFRIGDKVSVKASEILDGGVFTIIGMELRERQGWVYRLNINEWYPESCLEPYVEPTAPKYKKGDRVKYISKEHPEYWGEIFTVDGEIFYNDYHKNMQIDSIRCEKYNLCNVPLSDLEPYTESKEQPKASADVLGEFTPIPRFANPIIGFEQAYWQKYEADLAKDVALKVANKRSDPIEAAEYAVQVAKAVVENLKKK